jgi:hypothetical protein
MLFDQAGAFQPAKHQDHHQIGRTERAVQPRRIAQPVR